MLSTNCFVVTCRNTSQTIVIDPGFDTQQEQEEIVSYICKECLQLKYIVNTHGHPDHVCGNRALKDKFHIPICIHEDDAYMLGESGKETAHYFGYASTSPPADILLEDESSIKFGNTALRVVHTPGHSSGSIVLIGQDEVFTGDTLFAGSIGRTDFPASSDSEIRKSLRKLENLPNFFIVYPGHGSTTTMGQEKYVNPFLISIR